MKDRGSCSAARGSGGRQRNGQDARCPSRKVINRLAGDSRACAVCHTGARKPSLGIPPADARTREAALAAWRMRHFGGNFDPVRVAVDDAVSAFSGRQPRADRLIWLKVCNEIGFEAFLEVFFEQLSAARDARARHRPIRNLAAAFQRRLNRYTGHHAKKGGAA